MRKWDRVEAYKRKYPTTWQVMMSHIGKVAAHARWKAYYKQRAQLAAVNP